jgi:hypothetical protein
MSHPYCRIDAMRVRTVVQLVLLICLVFDLVHPWAPGVFFFEGDQLFLDGAVRVGMQKLPKPSPAHEPSPAVHIDASNQVAAQTWASGGETLRRVTPVPERWRYSSRSNDRSSPPPASPDAH